MYEVQQGVPYPKRCPKRTPRVRKERVKAAPTHQKTYTAWYDMMRRCDNPTYRSYRWYGARGIIVCRRWLVFRNFLADMGLCPPGLTLDRKDNELDYFLENCRWATWGNNERTNEIITDTQQGGDMDIDTEKLVRVYKKMRDARSALAKKFKTEDDDLKAKMEIVGNAMLGFLNSTNQESARTKEGTFYKQIETKPIGSDWGAFYKWVAENDAFDFLEKRIKVTEVVNYMKEHTETDAEGTVRPLLPPGVSVNQEWVIRVRKANTDNEGED